MLQEYNRTAKKGLDNRFYRQYNSDILTLSNKGSKMAFNHAKYYDTLFRKKGYHNIGGIWYYDAEGKYRVYNTAC